MITKEHIDALVALSARNDKETLTECLIGSVRRVATDADVLVYELTDGTHRREYGGSQVDGARYRDPALEQDNGRPLKDNAQFLEAVSSQGIVRVAATGDAGLRLIFPVRGMRAVAGLLVVDCPRCEQDTLYVIEALSQVWIGQQYLLDRMERDALTGLLNRHAFENRILAVFSPLVAALAQGEPVAPKCLGIIDVDRFKNINDQHGHLIGDEVLVQIARLMHAVFRGYDQLFRYGGEEFVVVLNQVTLAQAKAAMERLRKAVEGHKFPQLGPITVSGGVTEITGRDLPSTVVERADKALYYAKQNGRNQIAVYEDLIAERLLTPAQTSSGDVELF